MRPNKKEGSILLALILTFGLVSCTIAQTESKRCRDGPQAKIHLIMVEGREDGDGYRGLIGDTIVKGIGKEMGALDNPKLLKLKEGQPPKFQELDAYEQSTPKKPKQTPSPVGMITKKKGSESATNSSGNPTTATPEPNRIKRQEPRSTQNQTIGTCNPSQGNCGTTETLGTTICDQLKLVIREARKLGQREEPALIFFHGSLPSEADAQMNCIKSLGFNDLAPESNHVLVQGIADDRSRMRDFLGQHFKNWVVELGGAAPEEKRGILEIAINRQLFTAAQCVQGLLYMVYRCEEKWEWKCVAAYREDVARLMKDPIFVPTTTTAATTTTTTSTVEPSTETEYVSTSVEPAASSMDWEIGLAFLFLLLLAGLVLFAFCFLRFYRREKAQWDMANGEDGEEGSQTNQTGLTETNETAISDQTQLQSDIVSQMRSEKSKMKGPLKKGKNKGNETLSKEKDEGKELLIMEIEKNPEPLSKGKDKMKELPNKEKDKRKEPPSKEKDKKTEPLNKGTDKMKDPPNKEKENIKKPPIKEKDKKPEPPNEGKEKRNEPLNKDSAKKQQSEKMQSLEKKKDSGDNGKTGGKGGSNEAVQNSKQTGKKEMDEGQKSEGKSTTIAMTQMDPVTREMLEPKSQVGPPNARSAKKLEPNASRSDYITKSVTAKSFVV